MLHNGIIQPSSSPFASLVILVMKKWWHLEVLCGLQALECSNCQEQVPFAHCRWALWWAIWGYIFFKEKYEVRVPSNQIEARRWAQDSLQDTQWPLGVQGDAIWAHQCTCNISADMNTLFEPLLGKFVLIFMDDILVFRKTLEGHKKHLQEVFVILRDNNLYLKQSKCSFA
jgi:hypothetical protein